MNGSDQRWLLRRFKTIFQVKNRGQFLDRNSLIKEGGWIKIKKEEIRCKGTYRGDLCDRKLADMVPGFDMISKEAKIIEIKCPRCRAINLVINEISGKIIVELKE